MAKADTERITQLEAELTQAQVMIQAQADELASQLNTIIGLRHDLVIYRAQMNGSRTEGVDA